MRLSHCDQVIEAARKSSGVAIGKWPHQADDLREGRLVAPLGAKAEARVGGFFLEVADGAPADAVAAFVAWLRREVAASEPWPAAWAGAKRRTARQRATATDV